MTVHQTKNIVVMNKTITRVETESRPIGNKELPGYSFDRKFLFRILNRNKN